MAAAAEAAKPKDAFRKGLPFLFKNNATLATLCSMLAAIWAYNLYCDITDEPEMDNMLDNERGGARLADGSRLMPDGSIRRHDER